MPQDGRPNGGAAVGEAGAGGSPVQLVDPKRDEAAPLEAPQEAARRRDRDAHSSRYFADPGPVRALAQHYDGPPLGKRQVSAAVGLSQGSRGEGDRSDGNPLDIVGQAVAGGGQRGMPSRSAVSHRDDDRGYVPVGYQWRDGLASAA